MRGTRSAAVRGVRRVRDIVMEAEVRVFDFRSLISQSSFLSMLKAIAPRNVVVLRRPPEPTPAGPAGPAAPLHTLLAATLRGRFSHVHMPQACEVVKMASTAAFAATMTQELSQRVEDAPKVWRSPTCSHARPPQCATCTSPRHARDPLAEHCTGCVLMAQASARSVRLHVPAARHMRRLVTSTLNAQHRREFSPGTKAPLPA